MKRILEGMLFYKFVLTNVTKLEETFTCNKHPGYTSDCLTKSNNGICKHCEEHSNSGCQPYHSTTCDVIERVEDVTDKLDNLQMKLEELVSNCD